MRFEIKQSANYEGHDRWRWAVWLESMQEDLDLVDSVVWKLHYTFPQPVVKATNRDEKFRIERVGWGTFELGAEVRLKDGKSISLTHLLLLTYPEGATPRGWGKAQRSHKQVFLSFSAEDQRFAEVIKDELEKAGLRVKSPLDLSAGEPWAHAVRKMIQDSDAFVSVVTTDTPSEFIRAEERAAVDANMPVISLVKEGLEVQSQSNNVIPFAKENLRETVRGVLDRVKAVL